MKHKNKQTLTILALMFIIGFIIIVTADDVYNVLNKTIEVNKTTRDFLLTKTTDKQISPNITIVCEATTCKWNAYQNGIIASYDNQINRVKNESSGELYTNIEIENQVTSIVSKKLIDYSNIRITSKNYTKTSDGTITFTERK